MDLYGGGLMEKVSNKKALLGITIASVLWMLAVVVLLTFLIEGFPQ